MPGEQKGKRHAPGAGRPPVVEGARLERVTVTLPAQLVEWARGEGKGNVSAGLRRLLEDLDQLQGDPRVQAARRAQE